MNVGGADVAIGVDIFPKGRRTKWRISLARVSYNMKESRKMSIV